MIVLYKFVSSAPSKLHAFAGDREGANLPAQHGPWKPAGNIQPHQDIPYRLDRDVIEQAISEHGYQMWRMKADPETPVKRRAANSNR